MHVKSATSNGRPGKAKPGKAGQSWARLGKARQGWERPGKAGQGLARLQPCMGKARQGQAISSEGSESSEARSNIYS